MRTTLMRVLAAMLCLWAATARAQTNAVPGLAAEPAMTNKTPAAAALPPGIDTTVISLLSLDAELPLDTVINSMANDAKLKYRYAPELLVNNRPGPILTAPVGEARYEQMTAFEALSRLVRKNGLVMGRLGDNPEIVIGTKESKLTPLTPMGGDLDRGPGEESFDVFSDPTSELPLSTAILMLARISKVPVLIDPQLKEGGQRAVGTNVINIPSITNMTVNLGSMGDLPARQRLSAILNLHNLQMVFDPASQTWTVTYKEPGAREPMVPNVVQLRYSNTTNIEDLVRSTFSAAKIRSDSRTASLLVLSTQKDFEQITNLIAKLDTPTKQVLIEARFLETLQNPRSMKGIDWTGTLANNRVTFGNGTTQGDQADANPYRYSTDSAQTTRGPATTTTSTTSTPNSRDVTSSTVTSSGVTTLGQTAVSRITTLNPNSPGFTLNTANGFNPSTAFLNAQGVSAVLSFLNSESDTRTVATPRAVTLDNQETRLEVTRAIPIFDATEQVGQGGSTISSSRPNYTNVGTILIVTPRISGTNVGMKVRPEVSLVEQTIQKTVAGKVNEADIFRTSKIETQVIVPSGHTLVMGGLITDDTSKAYTKVPFFGDIPLLGWAFRHEDKQRRNSNLIIFLTPTIIEDDDYQPYRTKFLNEKMPEHSAIVDKPMDSGKPAKFGKKNKTKADPE